MGTEQFSLKWNNYESNLLNMFQEHLLNEAFVDVTLTCEGATLKAHKMVLSACSPYFQDLFLKNPCKHPIVILKDVKYEDLKDVVDFMYHGQVNVSQSRLSELLKTAETLNVKGLTQVNEKPDECESDVQDNLAQPSSLCPLPSPPSRGGEAQHTSLSKLRQSRPRKRLQSGVSVNADNQMAVLTKKRDSLEKVISKFRKIGESNEEVSGSITQGGSHHPHVGVPTLATPVTGMLKISEVRSVGESCTPEGELLTQTGVKEISETCSSSQTAIIEKTGFSNASASSLPEGDSQDNDPSDLTPFAESNIPAVPAQDERSAHTDISEDLARAGPSGSQSIFNKELNPKIIGGDDVDISRVRFMIAVFEARGFLCGAALVTPLVALTEASCTLRYDAGNLTGRIGNVNRNQGHFIRFSRINRHTSFNHVTHRYNLAFLWLSECLNSQLGIPIAILKDERIGSLSGVFSFYAWGPRYRGPNETYPNRMQKLQMKLVNRDFCIFHYVRPPRILYANEICALQATGNGAVGYDGNSGGVLLYEPVDSEPFLFGIFTKLVYGRPIENDDVSIFTEVGRHTTWLLANSNRQIRVRRM